MGPCYFCGWLETDKVWGDQLRPTCDDCYERIMGQKDANTLPVGACDRCGQHRTLWKVKHKHHTHYCYPCFKEHKYKPPKYTARQVIDMFVGE